MDSEFWAGLLERAFVPIVVAIVVWAITRRRTDAAAVKKTLSEAAKIDAESEVAEETVEAAVQLADIKTLQEHIATMGSAFREERESLTRRLERAESSANDAIDRVEILQADVKRSHRELIDMYRRDRYYEAAIEKFTEWINENLPRLLDRYPELTPPPHIIPLPPLHVPADDDMPARRWYDVDPEEFDDVRRDTPQ